MKSILLYDSLPVYRAGLSYLIRTAYPELKVHEAESAAALKDLSAIHAGGIALIGIRSYAEGIEVFKEIPDILAVQVFYENFSDVIRLRASTNKIGGLVERAAGTDELLKCFNSFLTTGHGYCMQTVNHLLQHYSGPDFPREKVKVMPNKTAVKNWKLTRREREIGSLLVEGRRATEIAALLRLKCSTVSTIKGKLFRKMEITNLIQLAERMSGV